MTCEKAERLRRYAEMLYACIRAQAALRLAHEDLMLDTNTYMAASERLGKLARKIAHKIIELADEVIESADKGGVREAV